MGEEVYNNQSTIKILFDDSDQQVFLNSVFFLSIYNVNFILNVNKKYLP